MTTPTESSLNSGRILVVEDNAEVVHVLTQMLSRAGYEVEACSSGSAALHLLESHGQAKPAFDLLTLDTHLSDMDGTEFLGELTLNTTVMPKPPVLMITGDPDFGLLEEYPQLLKGVLPKPFTLTEIINIVQLCLPLGESTTTAKVVSPKENEVPVAAVENEGEPIN